MKTDVLPDYLEVKLTGHPNGVAADVPEDLYTGSVLDVSAAAPYAVANLLGRTIVFSKVHRIIVNSAESKYYVHKNAVIAVVE